MTEDELFAGTSGPRNAAIVVVGEAWGSSEETARQPLVGLSGHEFNRMLVESGLRREDILCTNVVSRRPPANDMAVFFVPQKEVKKSGSKTYKGLTPRSDIWPEIDRTVQQIAAYPRRLVIGLGNYPLWLLGSAGVGGTATVKGTKVPNGVGNWRGSMLFVGHPILPAIPFLPIYHPAAILRQYAWRSVTIHDLKSRAPKAFGPVGSAGVAAAWSPPDRRLTPRPTFAEAKTYLDLWYQDCCRGPKRFAADIETFDRQIGCIGLAPSATRAVCFPSIDRDGDRITSYWKTAAEEEAIMTRLRRLLLHPNCHLIGQNFLYDLQYMAHWWLCPSFPKTDTLLTQHVLFPGTPKSLGYLSSLYCDHHVFWKEDGKEMGGGDITQWFTYNCMDLCKTFEVAVEQDKIVDAMKMREQVKFLHDCAWELAFDMMQRGIAIDQSLRMKMRMDMSAEAEKRQAILSKIAPQEMLDVKSDVPWFNSPSQTATLFYDILGLPTVFNRKTKRITTDDEAILTLRKRRPELGLMFRTLSDLRSIGVFQNTFLSAALDPDGRMRCSFNPAGTETFRWSSSTNAFGRGTNLQNVSSGDE